MTVSANLPLASYAAGLDDMIAKIVELKHTHPDLDVGSWGDGEPVEDPAALEWRVHASVDAMQDCHFTTAELQIMLALALDRMAR